MPTAPDMHNIVSRDPHCWRLEGDGTEAGDPRPTKADPTGVPATIFQMRKSDRRRVLIEVTQPGRVRTGP